MSEISSLQPLVSTLIGQGGQPGEAQRFYPFRSKRPQLTSPSSVPLPHASPSVKSVDQTEPAGKQASPHLVSTGSDVEAAALEAAILLTVGVVAQLLKNKKKRKNR